MMGLTTYNLFNTQWSDNKAADSATTRRLSIYFIPLLLKKLSYISSTLTARSQRKSKGVDAKS